jgi:hypothetical protein
MAIATRALRATSFRKSVELLSTYSTLVILLGTDYFIHHRFRPIIRLYFLDYSENRPQMSHDLY